MNDFKVIVVNTAIKLQRVSGRFFKKAPEVVRYWNTTIQWTKKEIREGGREKGRRKGRNKEKKS